MLLPLTPHEIQLRVATFIIEIILSIVLIAWMRLSERKHREGWHFLLSILGYGALIAVVCAFIEIKYSFNIPDLKEKAPQLVIQYGKLYEFINNISASIIEELGKYLVAVFTLINTRHFHKMSDSIMYLILIGLGFSLIEDAFFFLNPDTNSTYRLLTFYIHSGTSAIIGYSLGRYKFGLAGHGELLQSVLSAIALHSLYNIATSLDQQPLSFYFTLSITLYITLQIFILYRRAIAEEFNLEHQSKRVVNHTFLNLSK